MRMVVIALSLLVTVGRAGAQAAYVDPDTELAASHFKRGAQLYDEQKYEQAVTEFEAAYKLRPAPQLRYNIARANDRRGKWDEAIVDYEKYLKSSPPDADEVRARVQTLRSRLAENRPLALPPPPRPPAPTPTYKRWWPWTILGVGLAGAAVGLGVGLTVGAGTAPPPSSSLGSQPFMFK